MAAFTRCQAGRQHHAAERLAHVLCTPENNSRMLFQLSMQRLLLRWLLCQLVFSTSSDRFHYGSSMHLQFLLLFSYLPTPLIPSPTFLFIPLLVMFIVPCLHMSPVTSTVNLSPPHSSHFTAISPVSPCGQTLAHEKYPRLLLIKNTYFKSHASSRLLMSMSY